MIKIDLTFEQAKAMERAVQNHMDLCQEYLSWSDYSEFDEDIPAEFNDVSDYCGCDVCESRERFMATFNYMREAGIADIAVV